MSAKHTPGPWKAIVLLDGGRIESDDGGSIAWVGADDTVERADGRILERMSSTAKANARLIAAAPDLLDIVLQLDATADSQVAEHVMRRRAAIRAAIAKARGVA